MRFTLLSGVRNDLIQLISDQTFASESHLHTIEASVDSLIDVIGKRPLTINPLPIGFVLNIGVGAHGVTTRNTYTVPVNKRATINSGYVGMMMSTAGGAPVQISTSVSIVLAGGAAATVATLQYSPPILNVQQMIPLNLDYPLNAGDKVSFGTLAIGPGGNYEFSSALFITEYDA